MRVLCLICASLLLFGCKGKAKEKEPAPVPTAAPAAAEEASFSADGAALNGILVLDGSEEKSEGGAYTASEEDELAVLVRGGGKLHLVGADINKGGDSTSLLRCRTEGCNAAAAVTAGSLLTMENGIVTTRGAGATGVHVMGKDANAVLNNTMIVTSGATAPALAVVSGGAASADGSTLTVESAGTPCVYVAGGSMVLRGGTVKSLLAPCLSMEGAGSASCENVALTGASAILLSSGDALAPAVYQTDASAGEASQKASVALAGGSVKTDGTEALIVSSHPDASVSLRGVALENASGRLVSVTGGALLLSCEGQSLAGLVEAALETELTLSLTGGSHFTGAFAAEDARCISVSLDEASTLTLTEDSYIGALQDADARFTNIVGNGFSLYYDASLEVNAYLAGKSFLLTGGGYLIPII